MEDNSSKEEVQYMTFRFACAAGVCSLALSLPLLAGKKSVDCGKGQSLNSAAQEASPGDTITFTGVCKENVTVLTSGITLAGDSNAAIQSPSSSQDALLINGAQRVTLMNFTVQNGANGIHAQGVAGIILQNITAQNNAVTGIFVAGNSSASISNSSVLNNAVDGVDAEDSSSLIFTGSFTARGNMVFGINLGATSSATLNSATITASQNVLGIQVSLSSSMFLGDPGCTINAINNFTTGLTVGWGRIFSTSAGKLWPRETESLSFRVRGSTWTPPRL
jgi:hypothetical protein